MSKHHSHGEHHRPHHHKHHKHHASTPLKRLICVVGVLAALVLGTWLFVTAFDHDFQTGREHTPVVVTVPVEPPVMVQPDRDRRDEGPGCGAIDCNNEPPVVHQDNSPVSNHPYVMPPMIEPPIDNGPVITLPVDPPDVVVVVPHHKHKHHKHKHHKHKHHKHHKHRHHHHRHHRGAPAPEMGGMWMAPVAF